MEKLYVARLFDMFDGWLDITSPMSKEGTEKYWNEKTNNGTKMTCYADGDYWKIFPANTRMLMTPEYLGR
jgi:hypothetical protein